MTIKQAKRFERRLSQRIARTAALPASSERDARLDRERRRYTRSGGVKAVHLRKMRRMKGRADQTISRLADSLDVLTASNQSVTVHAKAKRAGGVRPICVLPTKLSLGQKIAGKLVTQQIAPPRGLYDWPGRGIHRHVADIRDALAERGPFAFMLDIRDCFDSVDLNAVYDLNLLPRELIEASIDSRLLTFRHSNRGDDLSLCFAASNWADPRGLLQGGSASSAIVVALLGDVFRGLHPSLWGGCYADDFIIVGSDRAMVDDAGGELARYLTGCPMGPSKFHTATGDVRDGFQHVGCLFEHFEDGTECWIPEGKLDDLLARMTSQIRNPRADDRDRSAGHFAAVALAPYPWAAKWQRQFIDETAVETLLTRSSPSVR